MTFEVDVTAGREPQCGHHGRGPEPDTEQGILVNILTNILVNILTNILVNILTNILINICDHGNVRQTQSKVVLQTVLDSDEAIFEHAPDNDNFDNICHAGNIHREAGQFDLAPDQYSLHSRPASQTGSYRYLLTDIIILQHCYYRFMNQHNHDQ